MSICILLCTIYYVHVHCKCGYAYACIIHCILYMWCVGGEHVRRYNMIV